MKYFKLLPIVLLFVGLMSCDVLDQSPQRSLAPEDVFVDQQGAENALFGAYDDLEIVSENNILFTELSSDLATHTGSFPTWGEINGHDIEADNVSAQDIWIDTYEVLNDVNGVIQNVPDIEDETFDQQERDNVIGQAYALRAYSYHLLSQWYSTGPNSNAPTNLGVPIITEPTEDFDQPDSHKVPRDGTLAVYQQIIGDYDEAISRLSGGAPASSVITEWGAKALQARAFLTGADKGVLSNSAYSSALTLANDIIDNGPFSLMPNYATIFEESQNSSEAIWELSFSSEDDNNLSFFARPNGAGGRFEYGPTAILAGLYGSGDERAGVNLRTVAGSTILGKYFRTDGNDNMVIVRLAEIILLSAEADVKANGDVAARTRAIDKINQIRNRADVGDSSLDPVTSTDQEVIDAIIEERARELTQEGLRWHDLVRTEKAETDLGVGDNNTRWPVPQRERDANPELDQNPGY